MPRGESREPRPDQRVEGRDAIESVSYTPGDAVRNQLRCSASGQLLRNVKSVPLPLLACVDFAQRG
jgi:hypothetical protein